MALASPTRSSAVPEEPVWRLSVEQYHRMIQAGILTEDDRIELLDGWLVEKMVKNPRHEAATRRIRKSLERALPAGWDVDKECPVTLVNQKSEPEPDVMVIRGDPREYEDRHPGPKDVALVIEVADSSLARDRGAKKRIYAAAGVSVYWIVNLIDSRIEVYTLPSGPASQPDYGSREDFRAGDAIPLLIDGQEVARVPVHDILL